MNNCCKILPKLNVTIKFRCFHYRALRCVIFCKPRLTTFEQNSTATAPNRKAITKTAVAV